MDSRAASANRVTSDWRPERWGPQSYNRIELSFASNLMSGEMDSLLVSREGPPETSWHLQFGLLRPSAEYPAEAAQLLSWRMLRLNGCYFKPLYLFSFVRVAIENHVKWLKNANSSNTTLKKYKEMNFCKRVLPSIWKTPILST